MAGWRDRDPGEQSPQGIMALTYMLHCFQDFDFVHHSTTNLRLGERERERERMGNRELRESAEADTGISLKSVSVGGRLISCK